MTRENPWDKARRKLAAPRPAPPPPPAVSPARRVAFIALSRAGDKFAPGLADLVDDIAARANADPRDAALAREIAFGVVRHGAALDALIDSLLERPIDPAKAWLRTALRMGAYQLLHLDRVPPHAAVSETVNLVACQEDGQHQRGFANAILRRIASAPRGESPAAAEFPPWIHTELLRALGTVPEVTAFLEASNRQAPLCLRLRPGSESVREAILADDSLDARPGSLVPDALILHGSGVHPARIPGFAEGLVTVEDEGAQAAAEIASHGAVGPVLDACAAPGGKLAHLADRFPGDVPIVATDSSAKRLVLLRETVARLGLGERIRLVEPADAEQQLPALGPFGLVLVDAPCSGLGTLRRHPEIRLRKTADDAERLAAAQQRILAQYAPLVAPGGVLAFVTCTVTATEGENVAERFERDHPGFTPDDAPGLAEPLARTRVRTGFHRTLPSRDGCDGFTIFRWKRQTSG
jgi:16S rRNA (cytosine967-C5)-methyltransferase